MSSINEFTRKTYTVPSTGHTYSYIRISPSIPGKSTIAFFHGFPSIAAHWHKQITHFASKGHGIFAPDLLGFGGSSSPPEATEYRSRLVVTDLIAILDHEGIRNFHGVGHDAGSYVLSRLYNYHARRVLSLTFIAVPYSPPATHFDLGVINAMTKKVVGFEKFAYCAFLASERAPLLIEEHLESFLSIAYHADVAVKADNFYPPGKLESWLTADRNDKDILLSPAEAEAWLAAFRASGFRGATRGYELMVSNLNEAHEKADLAAGKLTTRIGRGVPVLAIDAKADKGSMLGFMEGAIKGVAEGFEVKTVEKQGHYPHLVCPEEVNGWIGEVVAGVDE